MMIDPNDMLRMTQAPQQATIAPQMPTNGKPSFNPAYAPQPMTMASGGGLSQSFGGMLSGFGDWLGKNASGLASVGSIYGALDNASDIRDLGYATQQHLENMGKDLNTGSQFQGYGVTSGLGTSTVGTNGSIDLGVNPSTGLINEGMANQVGAGNAFNSAINASGGQSNADWNATAGNQLAASQGVNPNQGYFGGAAQTAADRSLADPSQRQGEIFDQLMAMQNPMLDQQQAQQQAREHAMGRGGVMGSAYGGTAEDAAMAKARAQASNQAALNAMQQADSERQMFGQMAGQYGQLGNQNYGMMADREAALASNAAQFGQLGNQANANATQHAGMLGNLGQAMGALGLDQQKAAYLPMQMQMELLNQGAANAGMAQQGQLQGQDYLAQLLLGGTNANINAQKVSSELMGNLYDSILDNLGGTATEDGSSSGLSGIGGLFQSIGGLFK